MNRKYTLLIITIVTIILWNIPYGKLVLYPFTILGTWFHEMAHGLAALFLGGNFHYLEIYSNGSGLAAHSGSLFFGPIGRAIVAGAGPIGPTLAGAVFLVASVNRKATRFVLFLLGFLLIASDILWVRSSFGFLIIAAFALIIMVISAKANDRFKQITLQILGVQAFASVYMSIGYLFSTGGSVGGTSLASDTQHMAESLVLPHYVWAAIILIFSALTLRKSLQYISKKSKENHGKD